MLRATPAGLVIVFVFVNVRAAPTMQAVPIVENKGLSDVQTGTEEAQPVGLDGPETSSLEDAVQTRLTVVQESPRSTYLEDRHTAGYIVVVTSTIYSIPTSVPSYDCPYMDMAPPLTRITVAGVAIGAVNGGVILVMFLVLLVLCTRFKKFCRKQSILLPETQWELTPFPASLERPRRIRKTSL